MPRCVPRRRHAEAPVQALVQAARSRYGRIDILVNNAGIIRKAFVKDMTEALWDAVVDVNLKATFLCSKAVLPAMIEARRGRIINIASIAAKVGEPTTSLQRGQMGRARVHALARAGGRAARHPRQRDLPRTDTHGARRARLARRR